MKFRDFNILLVGIVIAIGSYYAGVSHGGGVNTFTLNAFALLWIGVLIAFIGLIKVIRLFIKNM